MNDYELMESLGAAHPVEVSVTVAEAEQRERRGIPLPISGDPESDHAKELLRIRQERRAKVAAGGAAPAVRTEAAGLSFQIEATPIHLAVVPVAGGKNMVALIDEETGATAVLPLRFAAQIGNQLAKIGQALQHDEIEVRGLGRPVMGIGQLAHSIGKFLDGARQVPNVLVVGLSREVREFSSLLGTSSSPVKSHSFSPSVGAPNGAVCDNPNPTEAELDNPEEVTS